MPSLLSVSALIKPVARNHLVKNSELAHHIWNSPRCDGVLGGVPAVACVIHHEPEALGEALAESDRLRPGDCPLTRIGPERGGERQCAGREVGGRNSDLHAQQSLPSRRPSDGASRGGDALHLPRLASTGRRNKATGPEELHFQLRQPE